MSYRLFNYLPVLLLIFLSTFLSCSGQKIEPFEVPLEGKLVYVEGLRGEGWLTANPFGELVMIDGDTQTKQILTWDGYYYAHPNLTADTLSLIFESKRSDNIGSGGLSVNSDIYKMDLETNEVENFNEDLSDLIGESIGHRVRFPSLSHSGKKLAVTRLINWQFHLSVIDIQNGSIVDISTDEKLKPNSSAVLEWSANSNSFIYERFYGLNMMVVLVDVENLTTSVIKPVINETNELDVRSCRAGSWINNYEFIYQCIRKDIDFTDVLVYDIRNGSS